MKSSIAKLGMAATLFIFASVAMPVQAVTYTASTGNGQAGRAEFDFSPGGLTVTLFNEGNSYTSPYYANDVLTGLFFDFTPNSGSFTGASIDVNNANGSVLVNPDPNGTDIGQNFAYRQGAITTTFGGTPRQFNGFGVGSYNFAGSINPIFTSSNLFETNNTGTGGNLASIDYGLVNSTTSDTPLVDNSVVINFDGLTSGTVSNVMFVFGTGFGTNGVTAMGTTVPEPGFVQLGSLIALGGTGSLVGLRKRRKAKQAA